jgi:hypothetical protein
MGKRRWVQIDGKLIEVTEDYRGEPMHHGRVHGDLHYDGLQAPDGTDISTRTKHREYMKRHNLTTMDDFSGTWSRAQAQRDAYRTEGRGGAVTREDIGRAIHHLESRR